MRRYHGATGPSSALREAVAEAAFESRMLVSKLRGCPCFHARQPIKSTTPVVRSVFVASRNFSSLFIESTVICHDADLSRGRGVRVFHLDHSLHSRLQQ
jgi:hypothetical protein